MDRELMDWSSVWSKPDTLCVYIHCVMNAAYHETEYQGMTLKPGQFVTSAAKMAVECGLSEATVKRVFKRLETYHLIARQAIGKGTKSGTLITVANSAFQGDPNFNPDLQTSFDLADEDSAFVPLADPEALHYQRIRRKKENEEKIGIEQTRDHSAGMIKAETDEVRDILAYMRESGFCDLPSSGTPLLTVRQLLGEDHDPEDIKEEISAVVERSRDKDREPIRDALAYLVTRLNRKENGWSYEDNEEYQETNFTDDYE